MNQIASNLEQVNARIRRACSISGRDPTSVKLLAASKRTDANGVEIAVKSGHYLFGENRAQSLRDKYDALKFKCPEAEWHFIGHLQKNKVKYVVGRATMIHSLDSIDLAKAIVNRIKSQRDAGVLISPLKVLIQVKLGDEASKTGTPTSKVIPLSEELMNHPEVKLCGLMNIPPQHGEPKQWFSQMVELQQKGLQQGLPFHELSMGMSGDLEEAVKAGSTIVRLGTAIFGQSH